MAVYVLDMVVLGYRWYMGERAGRSKSAPRPGQMDARQLCCQQWRLAARVRRPRGPELGLWAGVLGQCVGRVWRAQHSSVAAGQPQPPHSGAGVCVGGVGGGGGGVPDLPARGNSARAPSQLPGGRCLARKRHAPGLRRGQAAVDGQRGHWVGGSKPTPTVGEMAVALATTCTAPPGRLAQCAPAADGVGRGSLHVRAAGNARGWQAAPGGAQPVCQGGPHSQPQAA